MSTSVTNGIGSEISVTDALPALIRIVPAVGTDGSHKGANYVKVTNTGTNTIYAIVNAEAADYVQANAVPIPAGGNFPFLGRGDIKKLFLRCASGLTSTATYGAY